MIPQHIRASVATARTSHFEGRLAVQSLPRLSAALARGDAVLAVDLNLSAPHGTAQLQGRITGLLPLQCRRCDAGFEFALDLGLDLHLVSDEEEESRLLQDADPYRIQDDQLPLHELIDEEVLLGLPMLPRCPACEAKIQQTPVQTLGVAEQGRENPFAALKGRLKRDE